MRSPYREAIERAATDHGFDPKLIEAVVWQESSGRADAFRFEPGFWQRYLVNHPDYVDEEPRRISASYGLMQIMYTTARQYGFSGKPEALFDIETNLTMGCRILRDLVSWSNGDLAQALAAYNGGKGAWRTPGPQRYARAILEHYHARRV